MKAGLEILAVVQEPHPNRRPFTGVLTYLDRPSDRAPKGTKNHRVVVTKQAAESALGTLIGMAVCYSEDYQAHDVRRKAGIITDAQIVDGRLDVQGYIYALDFPEFPREYDKRPDSWGMSYDLADAHIRDMRKSVWVLTKLTFTGAAILLRGKAAYNRTRFELV